MRVFVINAGVKRPDCSGGWLNAEMTRMAKEAFECRKIESIITDLNEKWDLEKEVEKVLGSDLLLVQTPIWAMSTPWQYTKWQDIVLTDPRVCGTDGRTRKDPNKLYGTGGFLTKKRYWISTTWNAPEDAVCEPGQFFDARGLEGVLMPLHKQFQYMGIKPLAPSFAIFDVYKNPTVESDLLRWKSTLEVVTGKLLIGQTQ